MLDPCPAVTLALDCALAGPAVKSRRTPARIKKSRFLRGDCDGMALALHDATSLPLGLWRGVYAHEDGDLDYENCHAVVVLDYAGLQWADVNGVQQGLPRCGFLNRVRRVELVPATAQEVREAFCCDVSWQDTSFALARQYLRENPALLRSFPRTDAGVRP